jgi:uncharacterized protein YceK
MKRLLIVMSALMTLAGCGSVEWLPDTTTPLRETTAVGEFVNSTRSSGSRRFLTTTTKGIFSTYTSLRVPVATPVTLERFHDPVTAKLVGQDLRAADLIVLVDSVMSLLP